MFASKTAQENKRLAWLSVSIISAAITLFVIAHSIVSNRVDDATKDIEAKVGLVFDAWSRWQVTHAQQDLDLAKESAREGIAASFIIYTQMIRDGGQPNEVPAVLREIGTKANDFELYGALTDLVEDLNQGDGSAAQSLGFTSSEAKAYTQCVSRLAGTWKDGYPGVIAGVPVFTPFYLYAQLRAEQNSCHDLFVDLD